MIQITTPDFAVFGPSGLERLYCKICGSIIGEIMQRPLPRASTPDGRVIERYVESFGHNSDYTEMKIAYEDGSAHVTNGCKRCFTTIIFTMEDLRLLTQADEVDLQLPHREAAPVGIVQIKPGGGII